jgi:hypothetical protein
MRSFYEFVRKMCNEVAPIPTVPQPGQQPASQPQLQKPMAKNAILKMQNNQNFKRDPEISHVLNLLSSAKIMRAIEEEEGVLLKQQQQQQPVPATPVVGQQSVVAGS